LFVASRASGLTGFGTETAGHLGTLTLEDRRGIRHAEEVPLFPNFFCDTSARNCQVFLVLLPNFLR
jgi:hypothetical protein